MNKLHLFTRLTCLPLPEHEALPKLPMNVYCLTADNRWTFYGRMNTHTTTFLPSGTYRFEVEE